jgi:o-succinylbenzoate---CoA ligase
VFDALSAMKNSPSVYPDWLAARASEFPDRTALVAGGRAWTYAELDGDATRMARQLAALGARNGDRIATLLNNGAAAAILPHATLRLGATIVPLNVRLSESEVAWQLADCAPRLLLGESRTLDEIRTADTGILSVSVDAEGAEQLGKPSLGDIEEADVPLRLTHEADSVLAIIYTSGTTGRPKGAMLTVANFWWSAAGSALNLGTQDNDRWLACLPLFHVGGLSIVIRSAIYGTTAVIHDGFEAKAVNAAIDNDGITMVSVVALMLERMLDARDSAPFPPTLRVALVGGGPAPRALLARAIAAGIPTAQTYGLTEACSQVATLLPDDAEQKLGSAGRVLRPNELRIASGDEREARPNEEGEILVKGPIVMAGYFGQPDAASRTIVDGWLHTGDVGRLDEDGYLFVLDRRDDLIVTGGENVYPAEVEAVLSSHPAVIEAAVIGVDDPQWGQRVVAIVRLDAESNTTHEASDLQTFCRANLAGYKIPREIRIVEDPLPRTASGKLRRATLRETATKNSS